VSGIKYVPTSFGIRVRNTLTGCFFDLQNVLLYYPIDASCRAPIALLPLTLPVGTNGTPYSVTFTASGGAGGPYTYGVSGGTLPPGSPAFALNSLTGVLSGTPNTPGTYAFTVQVTDAATNTTTNAYSLVVN
jgi:hypothetical protein